MNLLDERPGLSPPGMCDRSGFPAGINPAARPIAILLALVVTLFPATARAQNADPLGVKWTTLPSDAKPADLERDGISVELSRKDLEERLARLRKTLDAAKGPPRLLKTSYRAELVGNDLVGGGQWLIDQPGSGILRLPDLSIAIKKPRLDGKDAILGDLDGKRLGLWVEKPGPQTLLFDWSQRGTPATSGVSFELRLPPAPMIEVEIRLPADQTLAQGSSVGLLTGPHDIGNPAQKSWRLETTGRAAIELIVHRGSDTGRPPVVFASRKTRVQFSPESSHFEHDFQLEVMHTPLRELVFDVDPMLEPYEVTARQTPIKGWRVEPPSDKTGDKTKARARLRVQLREPLLGILPELRIRSVGPRWPDRETSLPDIALAKSIARAETLKLVFHPEQFLESWRPGSFRIEQLATEEDGSQSLGLIDTQPEGGSRPAFLLRPSTLEFNVRQESRWRLTTTGSELTSDLRYEVTRGRLFEVQLRLPKTGVWRVASVEPVAAIRKSSVAGRIVSVELNEGASPRKDFHLRVRLQSTKEGAKSAAAVVDFPDLEPLRAKLRQGTLAIIADAPYQMSLVQSSQPPIRVEPAAPREPRDPHLDWFFAFRQAPLTGKLRLVPQAPVVRVHARQDVVLTSDRAQVDARLELEPIVGQPTFVDVWLIGAEDAFQVEVDGAELQSRERLHAREFAPWTLQFGAGSPIARAFDRLSYPPGQAWRFHFRQPLQEAATLRIRYGISRLQGRAPPAASMSILAVDYGIPLVAGAVATRLEQRGLLPIVAVSGAEWTDGEVTVETVGVLIGKTYGAGLEPIGPATPNAPTRTFRFRDSSGMPTLGVWTTPRFGVESAQAVIDWAELTTSVDKTGNVLQNLRVRVRNWRAREFPVILPAGSDVVSIRSAGVDALRLATRSSADGIEVPIATAPSEGAQWLELIYRTPAKSAWAGLGIDPYVSEPKLPVAVLSWRTSLRLDRAWLPLHQERYASLERRALGQETLRSVWRAGEGLVEEIAPPSNPAWLDRQRLQMLEAESAPSMKALAPGATLGEAFSRLVLDAPKSAETLVIVLDRAALRTVGATPQSKVPQGARVFWEGLGLAYVPTPRGALLTSRDRADRWAAAIRSGGVLGATLITNVGRAAEFGQDGTGRFVAVDAWLRTEAPDARPPTDETREMSSWAAIDALDRDGDVLLHRGRIRWTACLAAIVVFVAAAGLRRAASAATFFRAIWIGVALVVLGLVVAPWALWELLFGPLTSLLIFLAIAYWDVSRSIRKTKPAPKSNPPRPAKSTQKALRASLGCGLVALAGSLFGHVALSQDPDSEAHTVYVLAGSRAFVRPEFVRWLETAERDAQLSTADAVFLASNYAGSWDGQRGVFQVDFDFHAFRSRTTLTIPLTGVDLLDGSFLDGSPAYPTVAAAGKAGYQLPIAKAGTHRLTMAFAVRLATPGDLRFGIPQTADTNLRWTMPARLGQPQTMRGTGAESLRPAPKDEQVLESQLGRESVLHLHWASATGSAGPGAMQVRELYFWDLRAGQRSALGVLAYRPTGPVSQVELQLSPRLEPRSVEATAGTTSIAKSWRIVGGDANRHLQIDLLKPTTTPFQVQLSLVPRGNAAPRVDELRLPLPLRAVPVEGHLAFRTDEPEFRERTQFLGMTEVPTERFMKEWTARVTREIAVPMKAYSFVRAAKNAAAALVEVTETPRPPHVDIAMVCTLQPQGVDLDAKLAIRSPDQLDVVPLRLPAGIALGEVRGADVHHWSRSGDVLQVWLKQPAPREPLTKDATGKQPWSATTLTLLGHASIPANDRKVKLPVPTMIGAAVDGIALTPQALGAWMLAPKSPAKERIDELGATTYVLATPLTTVEFALKPYAVAAAPTYRSLTSASMQGGVATVAMHVHGVCEAGPWPELQVRVVGWPTGTPRLHAPGFQHKTKHSKQGDDHVWTVTFPPGTPQQVAFSIGGRFAVDAGHELTLPELRIEHGNPVGSTLALVGAQPVGKRGVGWMALERPGEELAAFPSDLARLRKVGAIFLARSSGSGPLRVQPRETPTTAATKVLDSRYVVLPAAPGRWLHRMTWELAIKGRQEIDFRLPDGARLAAAFVGGRVATSRNADPQTITLPLPISAGPLAVEVCWTYPEGEDFDRPRLAPAKAVDLESSPALSTIQVPAGWRLSGASESLADTLLDEIRIRNQALVTLADLAVDEAGKATASRTLRDGAALVRHAQYRIRLSEASQFASKARERLTQLQEEQRTIARRLRLDMLPQKMERRPWEAEAPLIADAVDVGTPRRTEGRSAVLRSGTESLHFREAVTVGVLLIIGVVLLSYWPSGLRRWVALWPEQLAAAALLALVLEGFSLVGCAILLVAVLGRAVLATRWIRHRFVRRTAAALP